MKAALILYPHQLFPIDQLPDVQTVVVVEDPMFFGVDQEKPQKFHKQKLILHRASMRRYVEEVLWPAEYQVDYIELDVFMNSGDLLARVKNFDHVYLFDPIDETLTHRLLQTRRERGDGPPIEFLPSPNFYLKEQEVRDYMGGRHKPFASFYQWQRERFNILIGDDYKPLGGKWSLEAKKQKIPEGQTLPSFAVYGDNNHVHEAIKWADEHFPDNTGSTDFIWPTNHAEAAAWLEDFAENRLDNYAPYQDAIASQASWLYRSALSSSLNIGLLNPRQIVEVALKRHSKKPVDPASLETFIRQVLGWREYTRGRYVLESRIMRGANPLKSRRRLNAAWYDGKLGIPPFDDMVKKIDAHGYVHHTERIMIASNMMILCEIQPSDIEDWFNQLFVDTYDWITLPAVYGLSEFSNADIQLAISPSNVLLQTSDYQRGEWTDVWDGLYWRFIEKNQTAFKQSKRMRPAVQRLERLDTDRKRIISYRAEDFLANFTQ